MDDLENVLQDDLQHQNSNNSSVSQQQQQQQQLARKAAAATATTAPPPLMPDQGIRVANESELEISQSMSRAAVAVTSSFPTAAAAAADQNPQQTSTRLGNSQFRQLKPGQAGDASAIPAPKPVLLKPGGVVTVRSFLMHLYLPE